MSEVYAVMKQFSPDIIDVLQFDHQLQAHDTVKSLRDLQHIVFKGHGGTQPDVALEAFNKTDSLALFVITDGYFSKPKVVVDRPVFWCVFNNKKKQSKPESCVSYLNKSYRRKHQPINRPNLAGTLSS